MRKGFTLVELLVVIAIVAIAYACIFPMPSRAAKPEHVTRANCISSMRSIAAAIATYTQDYDGSLPEKDAGHALWPYMRRHSDFFCEGRVFSLVGKPAGEVDWQTIVAYEPTFPHLAYDELWCKNLHRSSVAYMDGHASVISQYDRDGRDMQAFLASRQLMELIPPSLPE